MSRYEQTKKFILDKLETELPGTLYYHGLHHVLDVLSAAETLGEMEKISSSDMELLKLAALFHDSGYIINSHNHEQHGCEIVKENLPRFGYTEKEIAAICSMIMATRYPQKPTTHLEEIICDADLDYLGRDDFFEIGNTLYRELRSQGALTNENDWNKLQETFLSSHSYFTKSARALRSEKKDSHLEQIRDELKLS
jgi:uncharacterized protein